MRTEINLLAAMLLGLAVPALAEQGIVSGRVVDKEGKPIAGYPVIVQNPQSVEQGFSDKVGVTSETGEFKIELDTPGDYSVVLPTQPEEAQQFSIEQQRKGGFASRLFGGRTVEPVDLGTIELK